MNESIGGIEPQRVLLELAHRARLTRTQSELGFMLANDSRQLVPYRQAALFLSGQRLPVLSGVVQAEANAPYVLWLRKVLEHARSNFKPGQVFTAAQLSPELAAQWAQWWPAHGLWVPLGEQGDLLLADDLAWTKPWASHAGLARSLLKTAMGRGAAFRGDGRPCWSRWLSQWPTRCK